ncbi:MAG: beta-hydroxyacyl-ACP dehydratase [Planctomycetota bacterium]|nr:beta-hydroxyacyl-ACP dehydratase [Planctomycetota bacterium]
MKFNLIDRIESVSDTRLVALKYVSLAEEYLADHFPTFPVLPGVLMLEAITQAAGWLLHRNSGFARSMAVLKDARNVKYGYFVAPGQSMRIEVEVVRLAPAGGAFTASATTQDKTALSAKIEMAYFNVSEHQPELADVDRRLVEHNRARWALLNQPDVLLPAFN